MTQRPGNQSWCGPVASRSRRVQRAAAIALAVLAQFAARAAAQDADATQAVIDGRLLDDRTRAPLGTGSIQLLRTDSSVVVTVFADSAGAFRIAIDAAGTYRLRAERLGYETATSGPIALTRGETIALDFLLSATAVLLDPIVVTATRREPASHYASLGMQEFYRRMRQRERAGTGTFLTRDSLARFETTGAGTAGMLGQSHGVQYAGSGRVTMRDGCTPRYYVNGAPFTPMPGMTIEMYPPAELEAVEIYVGTAVPGEFFGGNCGVVVLWTRRT
jgi:hypothetical protein